MSTFYVDNQTTKGGEVCSQWQANHAYSLGARCVCTTGYGTEAARARVFECTTAGTSHATTQPTWDTTVGNTTTDGGVTWTCREPTSWDNASCLLFYITNHAVAAAGGDTILVHEAHSEVQNSCSFLGATTLTTPTKIYCVDKADDSLSEGALIYAYNAGSVVFNGGALYSYGVKYKSNYDGISFTHNGRATHIVLEGSGSTEILHAGWGNVRLSGSGDYPMVVEVLNANINISPYAYGFDGGVGWFSMRGGAVLFNAGAGYLYATQGGGCQLCFEGVDLSSLPSTAELQNVNGSAGWYHAQNGTVILKGCKLPSTFAGGFSAQYPQKIGAGYFPWHRPKAHMAGNGNTVYEFREDSCMGYCQQETTIVRTGGASNGTTSHTVKMVSNDGAIELFNVLIGSGILGWTDSTDSTTFTVEGILDSATNLQNDEIWLELLYPLNASDPRFGVAMSRCAPLASPADVDASTETWTTTGLTNPNEFKLSVTVTPGKAGPIIARVHLAKASTTVYIDPKITES